VVSRHGCAPAMPTETELRHFLDAGVVTPRLREDSDLEHIHRATTRAPQALPLQVLAFDHRAQLEALAQSHGKPTERIAAFKALVAAAFLRVASGRRGAGAIVDDRYGAEVMGSLQGSGCWIARPVETPGSIPLAFEGGPGVALTLRAWPRSHVAKCLVLFDAGDPQELRATQLASLRALQQACAATGRELLLEVIASSRAATAEATARALDEIYVAGVRPDWWKVPPASQRSAWSAIDRVIERRDPLCRGVLVLGMDSGTEDLRQCFAEAARSPWVRGFAVGRAIFATAAEKWFGGQWDDARTIDEVAARYAEVITLWESAAANKKEYA